MDEPFAINGESETGEQYQRGEPRDSMFLQAQVRNLASNFSATLRVRNLSSSGMMADPVAGFAPGDRVEVELRNIGVVAGRVAWVRSDRLGVTFDSAIDPKLARKPVGRAGTASLPTRTTLR